ncbi:ArsR family transcriptional regulator [Candidatus Methanoliparum sp. LAM-1]|nr:ArsR family transcriptional regulator [Candidatus Methanoliparum sp. LAM-1]
MNTIDVSELFDILGNKTRREIIKLLSNKPCYVTEISDRLNIAPKAVIRHLKLLEDAGLVEYYNTDQNRKYFKISSNIYLNMIITAHRVGINAVPLNIRLRGEEYIPFDLDIMAKVLETDKRENILKIKYLTREINKSIEIEDYLNSTIHQIESRIASLEKELYSYIEEIDGLMKEEKDILKLISNKEYAEEEIIDILDLSPYTVEKSLNSLWTKGLILKKIINGEEFWSII